jgi:hypothetical protein
MQLVLDKPFCPAQSQIHEKGPAVPALRIAVQCWLGGVRRFMRPWSESTKQVLRHLAAARYFLPVTLKQTAGCDAEAQYETFLHHAEFELAMEYLEGLGELNRGFAEEPLFWTEMFAAAQLMGLTDDAVIFKTKLETHNAA